MYQSSCINKLDHELAKIYDLQPNNLHVPFLTNLYKLCTRPLKSLPFLYIVPVSLFIALAMYFVFGSLLIKLVSLLQHGF